MKYLNMVIIPLSVFLIGWSIRVSVIDMVENKKDLRAIISLSLPKEALYLMAIGLSLLIALFTTSIIFNRIKRHKKNNKLKLNYKDKKLYLLSFVDDGNH